MDFADPLLGTEDSSELPLQGVWKEPEWEPLEAEGSSELPPQEAWQEPELEPLEAECSSELPPQEAWPEPELESFSSAYVQEADLLATRHPRPKAPARPTKRRKLPLPKKRKADAPNANPVGASAKVPVETAAEAETADHENVWVVEEDAELMVGASNCPTAVPTISVPEARIAPSSPDSVMPLYEDGSSSEQSPCLASEVAEVEVISEAEAEEHTQAPRKHSHTATAVETHAPRRGAVGSDVQTAQEAVSEIEQQLSLVGRALQWLLCASKAQDAATACWEQALASVRTKPRHEMLEALILEVAHSAKDHMKICGVSALVPFEILAAKDSEGRWKHQRGAYELWRELVRTFTDHADPKWYNLQFKRWGALLEGLVNRAENAYTSLELAKRRAGDRH